MKKFFNSKLKVLLVIGLLVLLGVSAIINMTSAGRKEEKGSIVPPIDAKNEADRYIQLASENFFYREFEKAADNYHKAIALFEGQNKLKNAAKTYESLGDLYKFTGILDEAVNNYKRAFEYHSKIRNPMGGARALKKAGDLYKDRKNYKAAGEWYKKALGIVEGTDPHLVKAKVQEAMGYFYWKTEQIPQAVEQFRNARKTYEALKHQMGYDHVTKVLEMLKKESKTPPSAINPPSET